MNTVRSAYFPPCPLLHSFHPVIPPSFPQGPLLCSSFHALFYGPSILTGTICVVAGLEHTLELTGLLHKQSNDFSLSQNPLVEQSSRKSSGCLSPSSIHDWQLTGPVLCRLRTGRHPQQVWDHVRNAMSCPEDSISKCFFLCPACTFFSVLPSFTMFPEPQRRLYKCPV